MTYSDAPAVRVALRWTDDECYAYPFDAAGLPTESGMAMGTDVLDASARAMYVFDVLAVEG